MFVGWVYGGAHSLSHRLPGSVPRLSHWHLTASGKMSPHGEVLSSLRGPSTQTPRALLPQAIHTSFQYQKCLHLGKTHIYSPLEDNDFLGSALLTGVNVKNSTFHMKGVQHISIQSKTGFILCNLGRH